MVMNSVIYMCCHSESDLVSRNHDGWKRGIRVGTRTTRDSIKIIRTLTPDVSRSAIDESASRWGYRRRIKLRAQARELGFDLVAGEAVP